MHRSKYIRRTYECQPPEFADHKNWLLSIHHAQRLRHRYVGTTRPNIPLKFYHESSKEVVLMEIYDNHSAAIKNIQPCKLYPGDHAFPGTAAAQLPRRRRATSAETKAKDSDPNMSFLHVSRRTRRACKLSRGSVRAPIVSLVSLVLFCSPVALAHCFAP